ncbi:MAG TPA: hypothetical protein VMS73_10090 [Anaerolineaceae bacterium]|nr:hypothetical protein [Anaerolineaceae bacterium]
MVVTPDHQDALFCHVDEVPQSFARDTEPTIMDPKTRMDTSYVDRKNDIDEVLNGFLTDPQLEKLINIDHLGIAEHSLGGYTARAMVGGWPGWADLRFNAALLLSP